MPQKYAQNKSVFQREKLYQMFLQKQESYSSGQSLYR